jgi:transposase
MALRLVISDAVWAELEPVVRALKHYAGSPPQLSDRMFIEAVLYQARTGIPWRDLPDDFGNWDAVYNRFRRWEARQLWKRLWQHMQHTGCQLAKQVFIDSTIMRAHQHAAGARKKTVVNKPRLWAALGADCPPSCMPPVRMKTPASA